MIRLGDPNPASLSPLYTGQLLVHGMGFSPDRKTLAVVSVGSNSVSFIDTQTNAVKGVAYVGRSPHEAFFTPDGSEVWVTVRGENYVSVLDPNTFTEKQRITVPNGPGMTIFSPDGKYGYVCSSFTPQTVVVGSVAHDRRSRAAGQPVLSEHRRHARRFASVVYAQRHWQDPSLRRKTAVRTAENARHRAAHQSREHRA